MSVVKVLVINCGSSSLKFDLIRVDSHAAATNGRQPKIAGGMVERIGARPSMTVRDATGEHRSAPPVADHGAATALAVAWLRDAGHLAEDVDLVAHRVVHGGDRFTDPAVIDDDVMAGIRAASRLAPLHNAPALAGIFATREALGQSVPTVAVFDTAFHRTLPPRAATYGLPTDLAARHGLRRFGFHGIAHRALAQRWAELTNRPLADSRLLTLQLGNGASAAAVADGRSIDTTMGLTPLEGLVMGTRCGDIDPAIPGVLIREAGMSPDEVDEILNTRSGLVGLSGRSSEMAELLGAARAGDSAAALAIEVFTYRVRKQIGAYLAVLGGADAIIFGGGIGERSPEIRARVCGAMEWCGIELDQVRNSAAVAVEADISTERATIAAWVIPVDEAQVIAHDAAACLLAAAPPAG